MIKARLKSECLTVVGGFRPEGDPWLEGCQTALLIGPDEPRFWPHFKQQPEYLDGAPDPMDRFSKRVLNQITRDLEAKVFFPSDGPPYPPFIQWAFQAGCYSSPVNLLVHGTSGLFASFRGILALKERVALNLPKPNPCLSCATQPCQTACPIDALTPQGYDVEACRAYLRTDAGKPCLSGCMVRLACPVSQNFGRLVEQSEFHMREFLNN